VLEPDDSVEQQHVENVDGEGGADDRQFGRIQIVKAGEICARILSHFKVASSAGN